MMNSIERAYHILVSAWFAQLLIKPGLCPQGPAVGQFLAIYEARDALLALVED
jgi:hypothetical protein